MYIERREMVLRLRTINPEMKASHIAKEIGVTRERVRQILNMLGLPTRVGLLPVEYCLQCGKPRNRNRLFCSRACAWESKYIYLKCMGCGNDFKRREKLHAHNLRKGSSYVFCSKSCFGRHFGSQNRSAYTRNILRLLERIK
jgi:hypothetical protein|tara:strand:- start:1345 stop:1770 length:426 start_codon:yes stop_codon:yes gene_type:complete